jgi:hypothetical protein
MEMLQLLWSRRFPMVNTPQLVIPLNYNAIFSQAPLQSWILRLNCRLSWLQFFGKEHIKKIFLYCCFRIRCRRNMFAESLPTNCRCLFTVSRRRCITTGVHATIYLCYTAYEIAYRSTKLYWSNSCCCQAEIKKHFLRLLYFWSIGYSAKIS